MFENYDVIDEDWKMSSKLELIQYACNNYIQSNEKCNNCLRNIGFYSEIHKKWKKFKLNLDNNICEGYIFKDK
jgi:hypothetical protein